MSYTDDFDARLGNINLAPEAGEWAVVAMSCVAFADGDADEAEIARAEKLVVGSQVIQKTLGTDQARRLFDHELQALQVNPVGELEFQKARLRDMAGRITIQEDRDAAFFTLVSMATADREVSPAEYKLLVEFKEVIGSNVMIPMPQVNC